MSEDRKKDHINLTFESQTNERPWWFERLNYEPLLASHNHESLETTFLGKKLSVPFWVSSMTGGTASAGMINKRLANMCRSHGFGMGLGSCRPLLDSDEFFEDFNLRPILGHDLPLMANLGIYQVAQALQDTKRFERLTEILKRLQVDGLMVHVNPLQEWTQKEGDKFNESPLVTLQKLCNQAKFNIGVKEVGQGFGPVSLQKLIELPIKVIELAGFGGTNFTTLELKRQSALKPAIRAEFEEFTSLGHTPFEMIKVLNGLDTNCEFILSGGIDSALFGHFLSLNFNKKHIVGMASNFLKQAVEGEDALNDYASSLVEAKKMANSFVFLKEEI